MEKIKIITDSCADLTGKLMEENEIDYARMNTVYKGEETTASLTWEFYSPKELYDIMRNGDRVTTTQVPMEEFNRIFTKYLSEGFDIVYIGCSLKQSGSVNTGRIAAKELLKDYPDRKITCIDSLNACIGEGLLAIHAVNLVKKGLGYEQVVEQVMADRNKVVQYCTVHTLDYLKKAGRVTASKAFFGNLMGVKPILISDADGVQTPVAKGKGRVGSFKEVVSLVAEHVTDVKENVIYLGHADCSREEIDLIKSMLLEKLPEATIEEVIIGPIVGASIGPDAIGFWTLGKEVTYRVAEA